MKRTVITTIAALVCAALAPAAATATEVQLGTTATPIVAPTCPSGVSAANCTIILTRVTAVETLRDGVAYPSTARQAGRIVAFTVGLSRLSTSAATARSDIHQLDIAYGGTTRVAVTVLAPVGAKRKRNWKVVAESPEFHIQPYLGEVVQIPLLTTLPVAAGDVVALTTTTWAPVLSIDLTQSKFAYRQSRSSSCTTTPGTSAAQAVGQTATYGCNYPGTRVEYGATEITNPTATANPIHGGIRVLRRR